MSISNDYFNSHPELLESYYKCFSSFTSQPDLTKNLETLRSESKELYETRRSLKHDKKFFPL